jgi:hypothetical protein
MIPKTLAKLEQDLRNAAEAGRYDDVQRLAAALCRAGAAHLKAPPPHDYDTRCIAERIKTVLDWTLLMMLTARASCIEELNQALVANRYLHHAEAAPEKVSFNL